jgi:hypothetical protein
LFHFTPLLKSKLLVSRRIAEAEERSVYPDHNLVRSCRAFSLDLPSLRRTMARFGLPTERLRSIEANAREALRELDRDCWAAFLASDSAAESKIAMSLAGCFTGIGWFEADVDAKAKLAARWMGGGRCASVFVRVVAGCNYRLSVVAHHIRSAEMARGLSLRACGRALQVDRETQANGALLLSATIPTELSEAYGGRLWVVIGYDDSHGQEGWVSFSRLEATKVN